MSGVGSTEPPKSGGAGFAGAGADISQPREVLVLVHRGGEFLVLRRSPQYDGYWHPVAGGVEVGETETQAAAREVLEELGLDTDVRALDLHYSYPLREEPWRIALYGPGVEEVSVECFALEVEAAWEPTLNDEHDAYRWCVLEEAVELLFWPEPRDVLRELARRLAAA